MAASPELNKTSTVTKQFVVDYTTATFEPLTEHEVGGLDYRYVYGNDRLSVNITGVETSSGNLIENGNQIRLYYHMDYLGTSDYLTSPVSHKVTSWTHYNEWGEITHNAVLKTGQRELDLVKRYATYDYDAVLGMYYAKARMYDAENRRFASVDPVKGNIANPMTMVQYLYVVDNPLRYIDPTGKAAIIAEVAVYIGGTVLMFTYVEWVAWVNSPAGQEAIANATKVVINGVTYVGNGIQQFINPGTVSTLDIGKQISNSSSQIVQSSINIKTLEDAKNAANSYFEKPICDEAKESGEKQGNVDSKKGADEGTAPDYETAKKTGKKAPDNDEVVDEHGSLPRTGKPNSSTDLKRKEGGDVVQRRYYDSKGKAEVDIDYTDHGNPKNHPNPHADYWTWDGDKIIDRKQGPLPWDLP